MNGLRQVGDGTMPGESCLFAIGYSLYTVIIVKTSPSANKI